MTPAVQTYRAELRGLVAAEIEPRVAELERDGRFPADLVRRLGEQGFYQPCLSARGQAGVLGLDLRHFRVLIEELARSRCFGLTLTVSIHVGVFLPMVARLAGDGVREGLLDRGLRGQLLGAFAATELDASGSDFAGMRTTIETRGDRLVVDGQKHYIANAPVADYVVVFVRRRPGRDFASFSAVLVPTDAPGVRCSPIDMAVMRAGVTGRIELDQVELDAGHLLGRHGMGLRYFLEHVAVERLCGGVWAVAVAEDCLEDARRYAQARQIGDGSLWSRSAVRQRLAEASVRLAQLRALVDRVVGQSQRSGTIDRLDSAMVKAAVAPAMAEVVGTCVQLYGARGLEADSRMLQLLADFRAFGVAGGSTETMLELVAEGLVERSAAASARQRQPVGAS